MIRVLRLLSRPNVGGPMRQALSLYFAHRKMGVQTLLVVGRCEGNEAELSLNRTGLRRYGPEEAITQGTSADGVVQLDTLRRGFHPLLDRFASRTLKALLMSFSPHWLHTHTTKAGWLGRRALASLRAKSNVPVPIRTAHTFHGHVLRDYFPSPVAAYLAAQERRLARQTDLLFAVSPSCVAELDALNVVASARVTVLPAAVDTARFAAVPRDQARLRLQNAGVPPGAFVLGFVGRLVPIKQPLLFQQLVAQMPDTVGVVLGDGPLRAKMSHPAMYCLGAVAQPEDYLAGIDILVLPSLREGCPLVAIEAFAAGVPVVGFDVPGVHDVLASWGTGVLVAPSEGVAGLAGAITALRADPSRAAALCTQARSALHRFQPDTVAATMLNAYHTTAYTRDR